MLSVICSLVTVFVCWLMCRSYSKRIELSIANTNICTECLEEHRDALLSHKEHLESIDDWQEEMTIWTDKIVSELVRITNDLDIISSEGQKAITIPKVNIAPVNVKEEEDPLPIIGHGIIIGDTGSGKTNVAHSQIIRKIRAGQDVRIIDVKKELGPVYERHATIIDADDAEKAFREIVEIAEERQKLFAQAARDYKKVIRGIDDYNSLTGSNLQQITLVVEEWTYLMKSGVSEADLSKAIVICRSAGIWILLMLQYLRNDILSKPTAKQFTYKAFQGAYDAVAIRNLFHSIAVDQKERAKKFLSTVGNAVIEVKGKTELVAMPFIEDAVLEEWMNA